MNIKIFSIIALLPSMALGYDSVGNRTTTLCTDYVYDSANRLLSDCQYSYTYDANGNQTSQTSLSTGEKTIHTYDSLNKRVRTDFSGGTVCKYAYDGLGRKIQNSTILANGQRQDHGYIYDGDHILAIIDLKDRSLVVLYTYGPGMDEPLAMTDKDGKTTYFHADAQHSIVALTNEDAKVIERVEYSAYGVPYFADVRGSTPIVSNFSFTNNIFAFTGRPWDPLTKTHDHRNRDYNPRQGRFIQEDPIGFLGGDTNFYAYVGNNPTTYRDPFGLDIWIEGPIDNEPQGHLSISVGNPYGVYHGYSFGVNGGPWMQGAVYRDTTPGGVVLPDHYLKTTYAVDIEADLYFQSLLGNKMGYRPWRTCRSFSREQFTIIQQKFVTSKIRPPNRYVSEWRTKPIKVPRPFSSTVR